MPSWGASGFSDAASTQSAEMVMFHDYVSEILIFISIMVFYILVSISNNSLVDYNLSEGQELETFWTILPGMILIFIAFPSLQLLYFSEEAKSGVMSLKVSGSQWFWSYYYHDFQELKFESRSNSFAQETGSFMGVDYRLVLPCNYPLQFSVTANDVIHSWSIPALGVKVDATPGRSNCLFTEVARAGLFIGQCSEICGAQHSFSPVVLEVLSLKDFSFWMNLRF